MSALFKKQLGLVQREALAAHGDGYVAVRPETLG